MLQFSVNGNSFEWNEKHKRIFYNSKTQSFIPRTTKRRGKKREIFISQLQVNRLIGIAITFKWLFFPIEWAQCAHFIRSRSLSSTVDVIKTSIRPQMMWTHRLWILIFFSFWSLNSFEAIKYYIEDMQCHKFVINPWDVRPEHQSNVNN